MATVSNLVQYFIDGAMAGYISTIAPLTSFAYAVNQDGAVQNDIIRVPFVTATTSSATFSYATGYSGNNGGVQGKSITLANIAYQPWTQTDAEIQVLSPEVVALQGNKLGQKLAADVISNIWSNTISNANYPTSASYTAGQFTSSLAMPQLDFLANSANWPTDRNLIAGTSLWQSLLTNPQVNQAYAYGGPQAVQSGKIPAFFGFTPYKVNISLPASDNGFAATSNAIGVGMAYHQPGDASKTLVNAQKAVDPVSGLVLGYREWYDANAATTRRIIDVLYGSAVIDSTALIHIK